MSDFNRDDLFEQYGFSTEKSKSSVPDFGGFMAGTPVTVQEPAADTVEEYIAPAAAEPENVDPDLNYMASMQSMFNRLVEDNTEAPEAEPAADRASEPETELSSYLLGNDGDMPVRAQTDLLSPDPQEAGQKFHRKNSHKKKKGLRLNPEWLEESSR